MMTLSDSAFDSTYYGIRVGKLAIETATELAAGLALARERAIAVVFVRIPAGAAALLASEEPLETLVTLERAAGAAPDGPLVAIEEYGIVTAEADLAAISRVTDAITTSHLHADLRLPLAQTKRLYAAWARNDATGRAQRTFVARADGEIVGYLTALRAGDTAVIDLVAVEPGRHGGGLGSALIRSFLAWACTHRLSTRVGTQATNAALALYQRFGFEIVERQCTYHLWLDTP